MNDGSDDDLILMYRNGDLEAFDALFDRYHGPVYNFARSILGNADGAEEVLQETFLAAARAAASYTPRRRLRAWLMRIARNRCLNRIESDRARRAAIAESGLGAAEPAGNEPAPPDRAVTNERASVVRAAIARLPERQREAIVLHAFEQMTYREIADVLEMPVNTVKTLIHRARANLAQMLAMEANGSA